MSSQEVLIHPSGHLLYVTNFLSESDEVTVLHNIYADRSLKWIQLRNRRLVNIGGRPDANGMIVEPSPSWAVGPTSQIQIAVESLRIDGWDCKFGVVPAKINHLLINEYLSGSGILPHEDGPLYTASVAIVSLEGAVPLVFSPKRESDQEIWVLLEPRSLLVFRESFYTSYLHSIPDCHIDRVPVALCWNLPVVQAPSEGDFLLSKRSPRRTSLTYRNVVKTLRVNLSAIFGK